VNFGDSFEVWFGVDIGAGVLSGDIGLSVLIPKFHGSLFGMTVLFYTTFKTAVPTVPLFAVRLLSGVGFFSIAVSKSPAGLVLAVTSVVSVIAVIREGGSFGKGVCSIGTGSGLKFP